MGWFVHIAAPLQCVRCGEISDTGSDMQTKLLRAEMDNSCHDYRVGDAEIMVGLNDYLPLHPWDGKSELVVGLGDWSCHACRLWPQWAKVKFEVVGEVKQHQTYRHSVMHGDERRQLALHYQDFHVVLREVAALPLHLPGVLDDVHFLEESLVSSMCSWFGAPLGEKEWAWTAWADCSAEEKSSLLRDGYRQWLALHCPDAV